MKCKTETVNFKAAKVDGCFNFFGCLGDESNLCRSDNNLLQCEPASKLLKLLKEPLKRGESCTSATKQRLCLQSVVDLVKFLVGDKSER